MIHVESKPIIFFCDNFIRYYLLFLSILGKTCDALEILLCKNLNEICYDDEDCCSQYCSKSFQWFNGTCKQHSLEYNSDSNPTGTYIII